MLSRSEQARINGAKSKGPVTEEGKSRSSKNAIKHNLTARTFLLTNEDLPEAQAMIDEYIRRFRPADRVESDLVLSMVEVQSRVEIAGGVLGEEVLHAVVVYRTREQVALTILTAQHLQLLILLLSLDSLRDHFHPEIAREG